MRAATVHLGLTGGIGSGKSTVAGIWQGLGAGLVDADDISRRSTALGGAAIAPIAEAFGHDFIDASGALDRSKMRDLCFADPTQRKRLEGIVHPIVQAHMQQAALDLEEQGKRLVIWDIPLLAESGHWRTRLDKVCVVDCSTPTQIERVMTRSAQAGQAMTAAQVQAIIDAQASRTQRLACADMVIFNERLSLQELTLEVEKLASLLLDAPNG
jgi:dephospho-CoA kinase